MISNHFHMQNTLCNAVCAVNRHLVVSQTLRPFIQTLSRTRWCLNDPCSNGAQKKGREKQFLLVLMHKVFKCKLAPIVLLIRKTEQQQQKNIYQMGK